MANTQYFENCRCPRCKEGMDTVHITATNCPACNHEFNTREVWLTRRAPGTIPIPDWLSGKGPGLGLMALSALIFMVGYCVGVVPIGICSVIAGSGLVSVLLSDSLRDP